MKRSNELLAPEPEAVSVPEIGAASGKSVAVDDMDWNSTEGRTLLWRAYPNGYLAKRGIVSVMGWVCVEARTEHETSCWWAASPELSESIVGAKIFRLLAGLPDCRVSAGDLLPRPDPVDAATWACLVEDLAAAAGIKFVPGTILFGFHSIGDVWITRDDFSFECLEFHRLPGILPGITDMAEALVRTRIAVREATGS